MNLEDITIEEGQILTLFFDLLKDVSYDWAYALGESSREWVTCLYKKNGIWSEYMIQDGQRVELNTDGMSLYEICFCNLKLAGRGNIETTRYLLSAFTKEAPTKAKVMKKYF